MFFKDKLPSEKEEKMNFLPLDHVDLNLHLMVHVYDCLQAVKDILRNFRA